jgi:hypothetical protein
VGSQILNAVPTQGIKLQRPQTGVVTQRLPLC